jgi:hypothetical protein
LLAGLIRGAKHWPFHKVSALWESLIPIIRLALLNITVETVADWGVCFATAAVSQQFSSCAGTCCTYFSENEREITLHIDV